MSQGREVGYRSCGRRSMQTARSKERLAPLPRLIDEILQPARKRRHLPGVQRQKLCRSRSMADLDRDSALVGKERCLPILDLAVQLLRKPTVQNLCYLDLEVDRVIERERDLAADNLKTKAAITLKPFKPENPFVRCFHDGLPRDGRVRPVGIELWIMVGVPVIARR